MFINCPKIVQMSEGSGNRWCISLTPTSAVRALVVQFTKISQYVYLMTYGK